VDSTHRLGERDLQAGVLEQGEKARVEWTDDGKEEERSASRRSLNRVIEEVNFNALGMAIVLCVGAFLICINSTPSTLMS